MSRNHPYIPHTDEDIQRMCSTIGVESLEELLSPIPEELHLGRELSIPEGLSEKEVKALLTSISRENRPATEYASFLGAGSYNHYIPSAVAHLLSRAEFYTAYTPYQAEVSQGTLQAIFEYQTLICQLTGLEVSNASLYDGASALAEAVLMAQRITRRERIVISSSVHPEYRQTVRTYLSAQNCAIEEALFCTERGITIPEALEKMVDDKTACVVVQSPNFFGCIEELEAIGNIARSRGALFVVAVAEPLSLSVLRPPGEFGADIVCGEAQSFGNPMGFGGPYLGFLATREKYLRQIPGRIVGQTVDKDGRRAFTLTLSTREQHIKRQRATSNICTNESLSALACAIYLALLGKEGLKRLGRINLSLATYLKRALSGIDGIKQAFSSPTFNEFVITVEDAPSFLDRLLEENIIGGLNLERFYPNLKGSILITVTEMNTREELDRYIQQATAFFQKG